MNFACQLGMTDSESIINIKRTFYFYSEVGTNYFLIRGMCRINSGGGLSESN